MDPTQESSSCRAMPIYFDATNGKRAARSYSNMIPRPTKVKSRRLSEKHPVVKFNRPANITTNIPVSPAATHFSDLSPIWPLPEPTLTTDHDQDTLHSIRPLPSSRPLGYQANSTPLQPSEHANVPICKTTLGLGITNIEKKLPPIPVLPRPLTRVERSSNIAEAIEKTLWKYTSSRNVMKRWLLEIISWCISALCMAVIIGVLIFYRDGRIPTWPGKLTLNALISILSKISGAALILPVSEALGQLKWSWFRDSPKTMWDFEIFDNASRGPWGSILLLIRTKGRALAALGALITLLSLALDPFFQQVVDFPERWTAQGNSSIPRLVQYSPHYGAELMAGQEVSVNDPELSAVAAKFFYENGTQPVRFGNGTRPDIPLSCPTSNCTWPRYKTLGLCSECVQLDIPSQLTKGCRTTTVDWTSDLTGAHTQSTYPSATMCGYFLNYTSDSPVFVSGYLIDNETSTKGEALLMRSLPLVSNPDRLPLYGNGSIHFKSHRNPVIDVIVASSQNERQAVYAGEPPVMHECVVDWCVKTIQSWYYEGMYKEDVIDTFINSTAGPFPWVTSKFESEGLNGTGMDYLQDILLDPDDDTTSTFGLGNVTMMNTIFVFDDIFPSFSTVRNETEVPYLRYKLYKKGPVTRAMSSNPWGSPNNVTEHFERLTTAFTNVFRSSDTTNATIIGTAFSTESYVAVRWEWLALPLGLLLLTLLFLTATIRKTTLEEGSVGVWKTSAIATLLYGLPNEMQEKITRSSRHGTPRAKTKRLKVRLNPGTRWKASSSYFSPIPPRKVPSPLYIGPQNQPPPGWI